MPGISFITHKGVRTAYQNWENGKPYEIFAFIEKAKAMVVLQPKHIKY